MAIRNPFVDAEPPGPDFSQDEIPLPRQIPAPAPIMPEFLPEFEPEQAPYLPRQDRNPLLPFLLDTLASARFYGRGPGAIAPGIAFAGLQALARRRAAKGQQQEQDRTELNSRFKLAAAERNRQNLAASGRAYSGRIAELKAESARQRDLNEKHDPVLGPGDAMRLGLPIARAGKRISQLSPEEQQRVAPSVGWVTIETPQGPQTVPATSTAARNAGITPGPREKPPKVQTGAEIPTLSAVENDLARRASEISQSMGGSTPASQQLSGLARGVALTHARIRQATTTAELDSLIPAIDSASDTPAPIKAELKAGVEYRRKQLANPR